MRKLHLSPIEILPAITPEDREFAEKISTDFSLPLDEISWLVRDIRHDIQDDLSELRNDSSLQDDFNRYHDLLFAADAEVQSVTIATNKGNVLISRSDDWFNHFSDLIRKLQKELSTDLYHETKKLNQFSRTFPFNKIFIYFFTDTNLNDNQRRIAEGLFLIHFRQKGYKEILSEEEFNLGEESLIPGKKIKEGYPDWKHYISDRIRSRELRLLKDILH